MTALRSRRLKPEEASGTPGSGGRIFEPVIIDGVSFPELEVGFAWSKEDAAIADAKTRIDYLNQRSVIIEEKRRVSHV